MTVEATACCVGCGAVQPVDWFPLGRPRANGSQHPTRYCGECWVVLGTGRPILSPAEREARWRQVKRESRRRRRIERGH